LRLQTDPFCVGSGNTDIEHNASLERSFSSYLQGITVYITWQSVFTNVRFRSWSSKPLSVNAALF